MIIVKSLRQYQVGTDDFNLFNFVKYFDNKRYGLKIEYVEVPRNEPLKPALSDADGPVISVTQFLQEMMQLAWDEGLRPKGFDINNTSKEIEALKNHLSDFRKITFKNLKIK